MPHGGGGGSRSGGHISAGGGFHGSSGTSGNNTQYISNKPYRGARRFIYYYRRRPHVYYSDRMVTPTHDAWVGIFMMLIGLAAAVFVFCAVTVYQPGGKLARDYDDAIVIDDGLGIVKDEARLRGNLSEFLEQTGISICVVTREEQRHFSHTAVGYINNIEQYSYRAYTDRFKDEKHWVIFYAGLDTERAEEWAWYLTCGDDCTRLLDYDAEDRFTRMLQDYLQDTENNSFDDAVIKAVNRLEPDLKGCLVFRPGYRAGGREVGGQRFSLRVFWGEPEIYYIGMALGFALIGALEFLYTFREDKENKARAKAFETADSTAELTMAKCTFCGLDYYMGTVEACPYCGEDLLSRRDFYYDIIENSIGMEKEVGGDKLKMVEPSEQKGGMK